MNIKKLYERITGIESLKEIIEHQQKCIEKQDTYYTELFQNNCYVNNLQRECNSKNSIINELTDQIALKNDKIKQIEQKYEATIDEQYSEIMELRTQLEHATKNRKGKFYVFNPQHGMPRKIYDSYEVAQKDAESVAKISNGQKVSVLKIVSGVQIDKNFEDYAIMPEEDVPF